MTGSKLYNKDGVEFPTHTTPHNQVVVANVPDPSDDTMSNYVQLKNERELSWDQVASQVSVQDPALAEYLRSAGPGFEKSQAAKDAAGSRELLTELAHNPLSTKDERDAAEKGISPVEPVVPANTPATPAPKKATASK